MKKGVVVLAFGGEGVAEFGVARGEVSEAVFGEDAKGVAAGDGAALGEG